MTLRIIDAETALEAAIAKFEDALTAWAGAKSNVWQKDWREGAEAEGASYARREDVYIFVEKQKRDVLIGVSLAERDRDLFRAALPRAAPAADRKRYAIAEDDSDGQSYLLIAADELKRQGIREPFRRLAGVANIKRANVSERDYVLIGPLNDARAADALLSLGGLHPDFERHVERLAALAGESDAREETLLYPVSRQVERMHRAHEKIVAALFQTLHGAGYAIDDVETGLFRADFAMSLGAETLVFEIRADAALEDLIKALGQLTLAAPKAAGLTRILALPAPREQLGAALEPYFSTFEEHAISVLIYDFKDGEARFFLERADTGLSDGARALLNGASA
ncbi:MAG: hypothetical protein AB7O04_07865 [Hyphomonadaceae bacterium]